MAAKKNAWTPLDLTQVGAETPFQIRAGKQEATVVLTQHGQLLTASRRHLVEWKPEEMNLAVAEESAAPDATV